MSEETKSQSPQPVHPKTSKCKYCKQEIPPKALKCHHCGEYQNRSRLLAFLPLFMLIIATIQVLLGYIQTLETHKKYLDASDTLNKVEKTERDVNSLSKNIEKKVAEINNILDETKMKLAVLDRSVEDGNRAVAELQLLARFDTVVIKAQNNDRDAYDQLYKWSEDVNFPFRILALQTYQKIMDDHSSPVFFQDFEFPWKEGYDPSKYTFEQLKQIFSGLGEYPYMRRALLEYINKRKDISTFEKLNFFADVLKNDKHLMVCEYAGRYFRELTGLKTKALYLIIL
jgi:hypothetical protein